MRGQIRGLNKAYRNSEDGQNLVRTADAAMSEMHSVLQRMRELCVEAANDTYSSADRNNIKMEIDALSSEIEHISDDTEFNTIKLFEGKYTVTVTGGSGGGTVVPNGSSTTIDYANMGLSLMLGNGKITSTGKLSDDITLSPGMNLTGKVMLDSNGQQKDYVVGGQGIVGKTYKAAAFLNFDEAGTRYQIKDLIGQGFNSGCEHCTTARYNVSFVAGTGSKVTVNGKCNTLEVGIDGCNSGVDIVNKIISDANSWDFNDHYTQFAGTGSTLYVYDNCSTVDGKNSAKGYGAFEPVTRDSNYVMNLGNLSFTNSNNQTFTYRLKDYNFQVGANSKQAVSTYLPSINAKFLGIDTVGVLTHEDATNSITIVDSAINTISRERNRMGAIDNRLDHAKSIASITSENTQTAEAKIRDTDMADQMVEYAKNDILIQAAQSMLAHANSSPNGVLSLLQ